MLAKVELNKLHKRQAIFNASYNLFIENGFDATTISSISKRAGIGKGTFYLYYEDKYQVLEDIVKTKARALIYDSINELENNIKDNRDIRTFKKDLIFIVGQILNKLEKEEKLICFLDRNLPYDIVDDRLINIFSKGFIKGTSLDIIKMKLLIIIDLVRSYSYNIFIIEQSQKEINKDELRKNLFELILYIIE